ncbi:MAG: alpha-amylase, partial [Ardenticatenales bacterium]|nr:alpha-amylase [Ardenticatenales bacterium]
AALCQFTQMAPPILYYGTEVGVTQERDVLQGDFAILEEARQPMRWDTDQDRTLLAFYRRLIHFRRAHPASYQGTRIPLCADSVGLLAYARQHASETVITSLNNSDEAQTLTLSLAPLVAPPTHFTDLDGAPHAAPTATLRLTLPARSGTVLVGLV